MLLIITGYLNLIYNKNANQVDNKKKGVDDPLTSNTIEGSVRLKIQKAILVQKNLPKK